MAILHIVTTNSASVIGDGVTMACFHHGYVSGQV